MLGSELGGLVEIVTSQERGWLVRAGDVPAWSRAIARIAHMSADEWPHPDPGALRSTHEVAAEMNRLYRQLAGGKILPGLAVDARAWARLEP